MKVLVTDVKYRMSLAAIRDLGEAQHEIHVLHFGSDSPPAFFSRHVVGTHLAPDCTGADRAKVIKSCAEGIGADVIFPVGALSISALAAYPCPGVLLPCPQSLQLAGDKQALGHLAEKLEIPVPKEYVSPEAVERFPVVVKYINGEALGIHAAQRYKIVGDSQALSHAYKEMSKIAAAGGQDAPIIQSYIKGSGFGVSAVFDRESRPVSIICHKRLREYPIDGGPSTSCQAVWESSLVDYAVTLLRELQWQGIAMVEFRGSPETGYCMLEINPRIWGTFPLTRAARSGFSNAYVNAASGKHLPVYTKAQYALGIIMGFRYSNLAASLAHLKRGRIIEAFKAICDAYSKTIVDGVLDKTDPVASKMYKRSLWTRGHRN